MYTIKRIGKGQKNNEITIGLYVNLRMAKQALCSVILDTYNKFEGPDIFMAYNPDNHTGAICSCKKIIYKFEIIEID